MAFSRTRPMRYVDTRQRDDLWEPTPESIAYWILMYWFNFKSSHTPTIQRGLKQFVVCTTTVVLLISTSGLPTPLPPLLQNFLFNTDTNYRVSTSIYLQHPNHTKIPHIHHHPHIHYYFAETPMKFRLSMFHHHCNSKWGQGLIIFSFPLLKTSNK